MNKENCALKLVDEINQLKCCLHSTFYLLHSFLFFTLFYFPFCFFTFLQWIVKQRCASHISWAPSNCIVPSSYVFFIPSLLFVSLSFLLIPFFPPSFFIQSRQNKRNSFCRWQHLYVSISKDFRWNKLQIEEEKSTFPLVTTKILFYWFCKNISLAWQRHIPYFSFAPRSSALSVSRRRTVHGTARKRDVNSNKNMEILLLRSAESTIISHGFFYVHRTVHLYILTHSLPAI